MSSASIHDKLKRVRSPRVHIMYEVETNGAMVQKDLPFIVGVLGDFSGNNPGKPPAPMADRKFVKIDRDNFNDIMSKVAPGVKFRVENTLQGNGTEIPIELKMSSMEDFEPGQIVKQVEPLSKLLETRNKLRDLLTRVDRSENLESNLEEILQNTDKLKKLATDLGVSGPESTPAGEGDK